MEKEIKIAGAGLSGLTAGINLLKAGYGVVVYEQRKDVGLRFSNDFQGIVNWLTNRDVLQVLEEMNIDRNFFIAPVKKGLFFGAGLKHRANFKCSNPILYLVKRGTNADCLDTSLKRQFTKQGGKIQYSTKSNIKNINIIATGPRKARFVSYGYNFKTNLDDIVCEIIDKKLSPKAYAYLLIKNGQGTMATVMTENFKDREIYLKRTVSAFKKELDLVMKNKKRFQGFADCFLSNTAVKNGKIYTGEAAGFQDNLLGLGMFFAIRSGYLAAKSIIRKENYDDLWKKEFNSFFKATIVNRFLFELIGQGGSMFMTKVIKKHQKDLLDLMKKGYKFDWKKKLIYPLAYLFVRKKIKCN